MKTIGIRVDAAVDSPEHRKKVTIAADCGESGVR
jgi:hypothetical protein